MQKGFLVRNAEAAPKWSDSSAVPVLCEAGAANWCGRCGRDQPFSRGQAVESPS